MSNERKIVRKSLLGSRDESGNSKSLSEIE